MSGKIYECSECEFFFCIALVQLFDHPHQLPQTCQVTEQQLFDHPHQLPQTCQVTQQQVFDSHFNDKEILTILASLLRPSFTYAEGKEPIMGHKNNFCSIPNERRKDVCRLCFIWLFIVTVNDISVVDVMAHKMCMQPDKGWPYRLAPTP